jgi:hypothetical protein
MANDLTGNPLSVDTAAVITTKTVEIIKMTWKGATATNALSVTDNSGHALWSMIASTAFHDLQLDGLVAAGINVVTIASGTLYIYLK